MEGPTIEEAQAPVTASPVTEPPAFVTETEPVKKIKGRGPNKKKKEKSPLISSAVEEITRADKASGRAPRIPMDGTGPLVVPPQIRQEIKDKGCHARLCLDDGAGSIQRFLDAWWEYYEDANGQQFRRPGGRGQDHVLMMLPEALFKEDQELRRQNRRGKLQHETALDHSGGVKEYVPGDRDTVLTRD